MKHKDLGIIQIKLLKNENTDNLINLAKQYYNNNPYNQVCFFNSSSNIISTQNIPTLHLSQSKFFYGNLIVTDISALSLSITFPNINNILFFACDIPWLEKLKSYKDWENLFYHDRLKIIAKNQEIHDIYSICYKTPISISERLDYEKIEKFL